MSPGYILQHARPSLKLQERRLSKFLFLPKLSEWLQEAPGLVLLGCQPALRTRFTGHRCPCREGCHAHLSALAFFLQVSSPQELAVARVHVSGSW